MKYREHRANGHGTFVAFTLSVNPWLWFGACSAIGAFLGLYVF